MKVEKFEKFLNDFLKIELFNDYSLNGLQVEGKREIKKVVFAVSASAALFKEAVKIGADAIIVHHGLFWGKQEAVKGILKDRIKILIENEISLLAYHLPLDAHPDIGNNAVAAKELGLSKKRFFARHGGREIGIIGEFRGKKEYSLLKKRLVDIYGQIIYEANFGVKKVKSVAIVSGGAESDFIKAVEAGADVFITGEYGEQIQEIARECGKAFIACGHYVTEKKGVLALKSFVANRFPSLEVFFVDIFNSA